MSPLLLLAVGMLGGAGTIGRVLLDRAITGRAGRDFPYGTLGVNVLGSFLLGILVGAAVRDDAFDLAATGLLGAFTTFSTWTLESHRLGQRGRPHLAATNLALSLVLGLIATWSGRRFGLML